MRTSLKFETLFENEKNQLIGGFSKSVTSRGFDGFGSNEGGCNSCLGNPKPCGAANFTTLCDR